MTKKFTLTVNSHSLTSFQSCPQKWKLRELEELERSAFYPPFVKGELIHKILAVYDIERYKKRNSHENSLQIATEFMSEALIREPYSKLSQDYKTEVFIACSQYMDYYQNDQRKVLDVEVGFSIVIYEDKNFIFVLEGSIDVLTAFDTPGIIQPTEPELVPLDRKTYTRKESIYPYNNQFLGYCLATNARRFIIDYIGLTQAAPKDKFYRELHPVSQGKLDQFKSDIIETCFEMVSSLQSDYFPRRRAACQGKYRVCSYHEICEATNDKQKNWIKERDFVKVPPHRSW